jgi:LCP family protein required for cell wall assembly
MNRTTAPLRRLLAVAAVASLLTACGNPAPASPAVSATASGTPEASAFPAVKSPSPSPSPEASPSPSPSPPPIDLTTTPFTVLVLGGDDGFRTDSIIVAGIDPVKRRVTFVSLPRDTIDVPLPDGGVFRQQKVNGFYDFAAASPARYPQGAGRATADMMGKLLRIHIDFYAATSFAGFTNLVNAMGGVRVNVPRTVVDPNYQVTQTNIGIRFNAGVQVMGGARALIYARTRQGDNDFERARRQQVFLTAAGNQLLAKPALFSALLAARGNLITDFPLTQLPALVSAIGSIPSGSIVSGAVLGPSQYSTQTACPCGYALEPNVAAMRKIAASLFPWAVTP